MLSLETTAERFELEKYYGLPTTYRELESAVTS